jgi:hypothetical protein
VTWLADTCVNFGKTRPFMTLARLGWIAENDRLADIGVISPNSLGANLIWRNYCVRMEADSALSKNSRENVHGLESALNF